MSQARWQTKFELGLMTIVLIDGYIINSLLLTNPLTKETTKTFKECEG